jgi:polysaccharide pyruvyl transferase WcaK-like protein
MGFRDVEVGADPVFAADRHVAPSVGGSAGVAEARESQKMVVSLRRWFLKDEDGGTARQTALIDALAAAIAPYAEAGWRIEVVPLYHPRDLEPARAFAERLPDGTMVTVIDAALDWDGLLDRLATVDLVVTMRFHGLAAALIDDRPAVALAYEPKVAALAARTGVAVVPVDDPSFRTTIVAAIGAALEPRGPVTSALRTAALAEMHDAAERIVERALRGVLVDG